MTCRELARLLDCIADDYGDLDIVITWEGTFHHLYEDEVYPGRDSSPWEDNSLLVLLLNGDANCGKEQQVVDGWPGAQNMRSRRESR